MLEYPVYMQQLNEYPEYMQQLNIRLFSSVLEYPDDLNS